MHHLKWITFFFLSCWLYLENGKRKILVEPRFHPRSPTLCANNLLQIFSGTEMLEFLLIYKILELVIWSLVTFSECNKTTKFSIFDFLLWLRIDCQLFHNQEAWYCVEQCRILQDVQILLEKKKKKNQKTGFITN